jgi:hypothetical protein
VILCIFLNSCVFSHIYFIKMVLFILMDEELVKLIFSISDRLIEAILLWLKQNFLGLNSKAVACIFWSMIWSGSRSRVILLLDPDRTWLSMDFSRVTEWQGLCLNYWWTFLKSSLVNVTGVLEVCL